MRVAHIILAHKNPQQLWRLIGRLRHPDADIFVHVDKKVDERPFVRTDPQVTIRFIRNRTVCNWGGYSLSATILNALQEVVQSPIRYDFINLLSAQDYPLIAADDFVNLLKRSRGQSFISWFSHETTKPEEQEWLEKAKKRYSTYHFTDTGFKGRYFLQSLVNTFTAARKFPLPALYGSNKGTWWTISGDCAGFIANRYRNDTALFRFLKFTWGSDEFVIPSIIMNSPFADRAVNDNFRYIDWSEGKASPKTLLADDFEALIRSGNYFARKFDVETDAKVLDMIDSYVDTGR